MRKNPDPEKRTFLSIINALESLTLLTISGG